jgi:hypothetical protein
MDPDPNSPRIEKLHGGTWQFTVVVDGQALRWTGRDPADGEDWARRCTALATEVEVPPNAILLDGETSSDDLATLQAMACELHAECEANRAKIASGEYRVIPGSRRTEPMDLGSVAAFRVQLDRMKHSVKPADPRVACRAKVRRAAPRRLAVRRHRRAATRRQAAAGDDSGPSDPPPAQLALIVACGSTAAGIALGAALAVVLP